MIVDSFEATGVRINSYEKSSFFCFSDVQVNWNLICQIYVERAHKLLLWLPSAISRQVLGQVSYNNGENYIFPPSTTTDLYS